MALAALITWNYALNDETGFMLQRSTNSGSTWGISFPQPVTTSYVDTTVVPGGSYWYHIAATNAYGTGSYSNTGSVFIIPIPGGPSNLQVSSGSSILTWQSGSGPHDYYTVQRSTGGPFSEFQVSVIEISTDYNVTASYGGMSYNYQVAAIDVSGTSSFSNTASITFYQDPPPPESLLVSSGSAILEWNYFTLGTPVTFSVHRSYDGITFVPYAFALTTSYTDTQVFAGPETGSKYYYQVSASTAYARSGFSNTSSITFIYDPPVGVLTLNANSQSGYISVTVTGSLTGATPFTYEYFRSDNNGPFTLVAALLSTTEFDDFNVTSSGGGNNYNYYANAVNVYGTSSNSNTSSVTLSAGGPPMGVPIITTASFVPFTPVNLSVESGSAILTWNSASNNQDYFSVWKSLDGALFTQLDTVTGSISTYTDTNVTKSLTGTTYWYAVAAVGTAGTSSASNTASITFADTPLPPASLVVTSGSAVLNWVSQSNNIDFFVVQESLDNVSYVEIATIYPVNNLIVNGGFETGNYTGWTLVDASNDSFISTNAQYVHSGVYGSEFGPYGASIVPPGYGTLSQTVSTTPGAYYTMSFWLNAQDGGTLFQVWWDGAMIADLSPGPVVFTQYTYYVTASGATAVLEFRGDNEPAWYGIDDVSVGGTGGILLTTYTDETVSSSLAGNTYWYRVAAVNSNGTSSFSNTASITFAQTMASCWTLQTMTLTP
jgi:hypothetical protein